MRVRGCRWVEEDKMVEGESKARRLASAIEEDTCQCLR